MVTNETFYNLRCSRQHVFPKDSRGLRRRRQQHTFSSFFSTIYAVQSGARRNCTQKIVLFSGRIFSLVERLYSGKSETDWGATLSIIPSKKSFFHWWTDEPAKHLASLTHQLKMTHFSTDLAHCGTASRKAYLPNALLSSKLSFLQDSHIFCLFHMRWAAAAAAATYCITFNFLSSAFELLLSSCTTRIEHSWVSGTNYNFLHLGLGNEKIVFFWQQ